jgi:hypothetical protein
VDLTRRTLGGAWGHVRWCTENLAPVLESSEQGLVNRAKIKWNGPPWRAVAVAVVAEQPELQATRDGA